MEEGTGVKKGSEKKNESWVTEKICGPVSLTVYKALLSVLSQGIKNWQWSAFTVHKTIKFKNEHLLRKCDKALYDFSAKMLFFFKQWTVTWRQWKTKTNLSEHFFLLCAHCSRLRCLKGTSFLKNIFCRTDRRDWNKSLKSPLFYVQFVIWFLRLTSSGTGCAQQQVHSLEDFWLFIHVNSSRHFWIEELCAVRHFVRSSRQLMSKLWLAATQPHATQNRTGLILSTRVTCGHSTAK